jgi:putative OPT family oligopeptide transporter
MTNHQVSKYPPITAQGFHGVPRELTIRAVVLGFAVGLVLTAAITYLALYSGLAISAAIPAAMICTGIIRVFFRRASILENNLAQTIASSGEAMAVGVVFTIPALVLTGARQNLDYWEVTLTAALGGVLGVLFTIPLRRALTVESPELRYPESEAAATVARAGDQRARGLVPAALAVVVGAVFKALMSFFQVISTTVEGAVRVGGTVWYAGADMSLALTGVGVVVGLEFAAQLMVGGALSWLVALPLVAGRGAPGAGSTVAVAWDTWSTQVRFIGVGAMIIGGFWSIVRARHSIGRGARSALVGLRGNTRGQPSTDRDLPMAAVLASLGLVAAGTCVLVGVAVGSVWFGVGSALVIVVLVFAFTAVSGYVVGFVGNSNNPISGLAICAFLVASLLFIVIRVPVDARLTTSVLLISVFVCTATATAGDTAQHLKTGAILGATPWRIQLAQLAGVIGFAFVVAPIVVLLQRGYGIGTTDPDSLKAPQAAVFANLTHMVFGSGDVPRAMLWTGAAIALILIVADALLRRAGSEIRLYVMPVAVGMYLPISISVPLFLGGLMAHVLRRRTRYHGVPASEAAHSRAVLLSCGLITGEALVGVSAAVPRWLGWHPGPATASPALSVAALVFVLGSTFYLSVRTRKRQSPNVKTTTRSQA